MRRRIVRTTALLTALTLAVFCSVTVTTAAVRIAATERAELQQEADRVAAGLSASLERADEGGRSAEELGERLSWFDRYLRAGEFIEVRMPDGRTFTAGERRPDQDLSATSSGYPVEVTVREPGQNFFSAAVGVGLIALVIGLVVLVLAVLVARRLADRLVAPLAALATAADRLGQGDARPAKLRWGIRELDEVSAVLDMSAERIGEQLAAERRLAGDLSHQIRTPLTALSMRLEEILGADDPGTVRTEATVALQQVERLSTVVDDIMAFARQSPTAQQDVDVDTVLAQQHDEWTPAFRSEGRRLVLKGPRGLVARSSPGRLAQVVSTLLENSLVHGEGTTTVATRTSGRWTVIEVSDEGPGVPDDHVSRIFERGFSGARRSGVGLSVARALTEVEGGRLELTRRRPPLFAVFLAAGPTRDPEVLGSPEVQAQDAPGAQRHDDDPPTSRAQRRGSTDAEGAVPPVPPAAG